MAHLRWHTSDGIPQMAHLRWHTSEFFENLTFFNVGKKKPAKVKPEYRRRGQKAALIN